MQEEEEIWKDVKESGGLYEVSYCGKIRRKENGRIRALAVKPNGYIHVSLKLGKEKWNSKNFYVHRLVVSNWIGDIPKGMAVNHKDGVKSNNSASNLEIVTYSENMKHAIANNLNTVPLIIGSNHSNSVTNESDVFEMRKMHINGTSYKDVAKTFNININTVKQILYRDTWKHVEKPILLS